MQAKLVYGFLVLRRISEYEVADLLQAMKYRIRVRVFLEGCECIKLDTSLQRCKLLVLRRRRRHVEFTAVLVTEKERDSWDSLHHSRHFKLPDTSFGEHPTSELRLRNDTIHVRLGTQYTYDRSIVICLVVYTSSVEVILRNRV